MAVTIPINEQVFEIRFKPDPEVLDHRGEWAKSTSAHLGMEHWQIVDNRFDVFNEKQVEHFFVSFRNAGYSAINTPGKSFFSERSGKFLRHLYGLTGFNDNLFIERIGVLSKFCTPFKGKYDDLVSLFSQKYMGLTDEAHEAIGKNAKIADIGAPVNFEDRFGTFNTGCGPAKRAQLQEFFSKHTSLPEIGFFYYIDYFQTPKGNLKGKDIIEIIAKLSLESWERHERVRNLVLPVNQVKNRPAF